MFLRRSHIFAIPPRNSLRRKAPRVKVKLLASSLPPLRLPVRYWPGKVQVTYADNTVGTRKQDSRQQWMHVGCNHTRGHLFRYVKRNIFCSQEMVLNPSLAPHRDIKLNLLRPHWTTAVVYKIFIKEVANKNSETINRQAFLENCE